MFQGNNVTILQFQSNNCFHVLYFFHIIAISLEWDKQPQYQEASLMMKGYTGEAAREALVRRKSEGMMGPHRQLGIPMSSAATREQVCYIFTAIDVRLKKSKCVY